MSELLKLPYILTDWVKEIGGERKNPVTANLPIISVV